MLPIPPFRGTSIPTIDISRNLGFFHWDVLNARQFSGKFEARDPGGGEISPRHKLSYFTLL